MPVNVRFFGNLVDQFGAERVLGLSRSQHFEHRILRHHHERVLLGIVLGLLHRDQFDVRRPVGRLEMSLDVGLKRTLVVAETTREPPQAVTLEMLQQGWDVLELLGAVVTVELDLGELADQLVVAELRHASRGVVAVGVAAAVEGVALHTVLVLW